jgi:hypothetical protein
VTATDGSVKQQKKHCAAFFRRYSVCTRGFDHTDGSTRGRTPVLTPDAAASDPACVRSAAVSTAYHPMGMSIWYFRCTPLLMPGSDKSRHTGRHRFVTASNCGSVVYDHWTSHAATSYRRRGGGQKPAPFSRGAFRSGNCRACPKRTSRPSEPAPRGKS